MSGFLPPPFGDHHGEYSGLDSGDAISPTCVDIVPRGAVFLGQRTLNIPVRSKIEAILVAKQCDPGYVSKPIAEFVAHAREKNLTSRGARIVFTIASTAFVTGAWQLVADIYAIFP